MSAIRVANVQFDAASTTRIDNPVTNTIMITTAGIEAARVDPAGNVGIGITSPTSKLHVSGTVNLTGTLAVTGDVNAVSNVVINKQAVVYYNPSTTLNAAIHVIAANTNGGAGYADFFKLTNSSQPAVTNPNKFIRIDNTGSLQVVNSSYQATSLTLTDGGNLTVGGTVGDSVGTLRPMVSTSNNALGSNVAFTGIPTWAKRITVTFNNVGANVASTFAIRVGTPSGGFATSGYVSLATDGTNVVSNSIMLVVDSGAASAGGRKNIICTLVNSSGNNWLMSGLGLPNTSSGFWMTGAITLTDYLDRIQAIQQTPLSANYNAGTIAVMYE